MAIAQAHALEVIFTWQRLVVYLVRFNMKLESLCGRAKTHSLSGTIACRPTISDLALSFLDVQEFMFC